MYYYRHKYHTPELSKQVCIRVAEGIYVASKDRHRAHARRKMKMSTALDDWHITLYSSGMHTAFIFLVRICWLFEFYLNPWVWVRSMSQTFLRPRRLCWFSSSIVAASIGGKAYFSCSSDWPKCTSCWCWIWMFGTTRSLCDNDGSWRNGLGLYGFPW